MEDVPPTGPSSDILNERITFVVPSNSDFERIIGFKNFTTLWNVGSANAIGVSSGNHNLSKGYQLSVDNKDSVNGLHSLLTRLSNGNKDELHQILNYLWIGAVVTLVILSLVFIVFSFYFYRKFVEWKKCNKDIQSQIPTDSQHPCRREDNYYSVESPPCYTIATGLPTYGEALLQYAVQYEHQLSYLWLPSLWTYSQLQGKQLKQHQGAIMTGKDVDKLGLESCENISPAFRKESSNATAEQGDNINRTADTICLRHAVSFSQNLMGDNNLIDVVVLS